MSQQSRRTFLKSAATIAGAATSISFAGRKGFGQVIGSNETINMAVVGINGRGGSHIGEFGDMPNVRVAALCDVDLDVLDKRGKGVENAQKYQDVRRLLENKDIDAVSIATTNHWHALIAIWACQAGKDVYVEKPCSHNVFEGRQLVEAAKKYNRIVQHGTQSRSDADWCKQAAIVKSGKYGKLLVSKGYCAKSRWSIGYEPIKTPPKNLDFNIWLGPAPAQPYHANLVHYDWHWFWDTGNGDVGNQGVHQMDIARWLTGKTLPTSVMSLGGRWVDEPDFKDQAETPNQLVSVFDYGDTIVLFETRGLVGNKKYPDWPAKVTNELYFEQGAIKGDKFFPRGSTEGQPLVEVEFEKPKPGGHFGNFINACRTRKTEDLNAPIEEGHRSAALCHLGNISYRLGGPQKFEVPEAFAGNEIVRESVQTALDNAKAIGVDPAKTKLWVGPQLAFDPEKEKFVDNTAADWFLSRPYRAPFVVPEQV